MDNLHTTTFCIESHDPKAYMCKLLGIDAKREYIRAWGQKRYVPDRSRKLMRHSLYLREGDWCEIKRDGRKKAYQVRNGELEQRPYPTIYDFRAKWIKDAV